MKNKKKIIILTSMILGILIVTLGITYSYFTFNQTGTSSELIVGDIYMHYKETDKTIELTNAYPEYFTKKAMLTGKYYLNDIIKYQEETVVNELTRCINELPAAGISEENLDEGTTLETLCKGTGTFQSMTLQQMIDYYYVANNMTTELTYLQSKGILIIEDGNYKVNPVIPEQEITVLNELSYCMDMVSTYELQTGEDYNSFCKGNGTIQGKTYLEHQEENTDLYQSTKSNFEDNNIIVYKDIITNPNLSYFEFTIDGKNTYEKEDIKYEIKLSYGENTSNRTERIEDKYLRFSLVELKGTDQVIVLHDVGYSDLSNASIYKDKIRSGENTNKTYRLYMWISSEVEIGNTENTTYDIETWETIYASIKVNVEGDFTEKTLSEKYLPETGAGEIMSKLGTGGLVAINNDGGLYTGSGVIREYRYSGLNVNNYIIFNDDGDETTEVNELWRIVGVFQNSEGKWNLKLMRDTVLTSEEMPNTYTINGTRFTIENSTTGNASWTLKPSGTDYNDWTTAGLQYFLNTERDDNGTAGYYSTFTENAKKLIDTNYTYYLGNVKYGNIGDNGDTARSSYRSERSSVVCDSSVQEDSHNYNCNIWNGNQATWKGAIGLLYPSDYGYSAPKIYWNIALGDYEIAAYSLSWMQQTANHSSWEWFLSPSSRRSPRVAYWDTVGSVGWYTAYSSRGVRGVLNLKSQAKIEGNHEGSKNDPYIVIES